MRWPQFEEAPIYVTHLYNMHKPSIDKYQDRVVPKLAGS